MKKMDYYNFFLLYIKMNATTYYQRNRDVILNREKDYYKNHKERFRDNARDKYRNLSEEEKDKKTKYGRNIYYNMSEEKIKANEANKNKKSQFKKKMHDYIHSKLLILLNFFFYLYSLS